MHPNTNTGTPRTRLITTAAAMLSAGSGLMVDADKEIIKTVQDIHLRPVSKGPQPGIVPTLSAKNDPMPIRQATMNPIVSSIY